MKKIFIANWKMNPQTLSEAKELFDFYIQGAIKHSDVTIVVCPPFLYIEELARLLHGHHVHDAHVRNLFLGVQDFFWEEAGAFTGQISLNMLKQFDISYALLGHSERRYIAGETDEMINRKLLTALRHNIRPILLVGEKEKGEYREDILIDQLSRDLAGVKPEDAGRLLITYEPVWAISSHSGGHSDTPKSAMEAVHTIRQILQKIFGQVVQELPMLYGGSVNLENAASFLSHPEIAGVVVGSASLVPGEFGKILEITTRL